MDDDLKTMTPDELRAEVLKLRTGIRTHRDASGHDLCWFHPELWSLLPERGEYVKPEVPPKDEFHRRCVLYRESLGK